MAPICMCLTKSCLRTGGRLKTAQTHACQLNATHKPPRPLSAHWLVQGDDSAAPSPSRKRSADGMLPPSEAEEQREAATQPAVKRLRTSVGGFLSRMLSAASGAVAQAFGGGQAPLPPAEAAASTTSMPMHDADTNRAAMARPSLASPANSSGDDGPPPLVADSQEQVRPLYAPAGSRDDRPSFHQDDSCCSRDSRN